MRRAIGPERAMSETAVIASGNDTAKAPFMGMFERYLTVWVALCIVVGIALGHLIPGAFQAVAALEVAKVNLPVAALIWLMIVPMLLKIDFQALGQVKEHWRGVGVTLFINWAVKPFSMALLAWLFINTGAKWMDLRDDEDEGLHRYTSRLKIRHDRVDEGIRSRK